MLKEFTVDFRTHEAWNFRIGLALSAAGSGASLLVFSFLTGMRAGTFVGLGMDCLGVAALFADLGHRMRFWRAVTKVTQTWISLGTLVTTGLLVFGVLFLLTPEESPLWVVFKIISLVCALTVLVYASFLLSSMAAIPFWHNSLLPVLFVGHSATSGVAIMLGILPLVGQSIGSYSKELSVAIALLLFSFLLTWLYTKSVSPSNAARESVRLLTEGRLKSLFVGGAYVIGLLVPLGLIIVYYLTSQDLGVIATVLIVAAMVLRFVGDVSFRYSVLRAGVYEAII
jgi:formate-dependent nitrite reductase membrane component NrfD